MGIVPSVESGLRLSAHTRPGEPLRLLPREPTTVFGNRCPFAPLLHQGEQFLLVLTEGVVQSGGQDAFGRATAYRAIGVRRQDDTTLVELLEQGECSHMTTSS